MGQLATWEVFEHIKHIRQREAMDRVWGVRIASHPHADKQFQRDNSREIQKSGECGSAKRRKSSFDLADSDETRLRMIGGELASCEAKWDEWVVKHPRHMKWLKDSGKTLHDAREAFDEWWEVQSRLGTEDEFRSDDSDDQAVRE